MNPIYLWFLGKKGQSGMVTGAIMAIGIAVILIYIMSLVVQNIDTSFSSEFVGQTYEGVYNKTKANSITGFNLMTIVIILIAASALLGAVFMFAKR